MFGSIYSQPLHTFFDGIAHKQGYGHLTVYLYAPFLAPSVVAYRVILLLENWTGECEHTPGKGVEIKQNTYSWFRDYRKGTTERGSSERAEKFPPRKSQSPQNFFFSGNIEKNGGMHQQELTAHHWNCKDDSAYQKSSHYPLSSFRISCLHPDNGNSDDLRAM